MRTLGEKPVTIDLLCFSHLRWNFVYQRPQHLMTRFAKSGRVFYIEEPIWDANESRLQVSDGGQGVSVVVPHLSNFDQTNSSKILRHLLDELISDYKIESFCLWYYTPMALEWTCHLTADALSVIYDCMDELSGFAGAPSDLIDREEELLVFADVVFTGGHSLFESKRRLHPNVYAFPSSVDQQHFAQARGRLATPEDQLSIASPRIGYFGVIDERMDLDLLRVLAEVRPEWNFVMIGPVVKIKESQLPRLKNIHYLGMKSYQDLPNYIAGWDAAILPFARNESTRFISPTKTPEYLAAGRPVISTSIADVVNPYGLMGLVHIADDAQGFIAAIEKAIAEDPEKRIRQVDAMLSKDCWSRTWRRMVELIDDSIQASRRDHPSLTPVKLASKAATAGRIA